MRMLKIKNMIAGTEKGWDVFSLEYDVRGPLASVLTNGAQNAAALSAHQRSLAAGAGAGGAFALSPLERDAAAAGGSAMQRYGRLSALLWRLKRVEAALGHSWLTLKTQAERLLPKLGRGRGPVEAVVRQALALRHRLAHFATSVQYYVHFEAMEAAWRSFTARARAARDLDALIAAHEEYQADLLSKCLLDEAAGPLRGALEALCANALGVRPITADLNKLVAAAEHLVYAQRQRVAERAKEGAWGTTAADYAAGAAAEQEELIPRAELENIARRLQDLEAHHAEYLAAFRAALPAAAHDEVRFLLSRLEAGAQGATSTLSADGFA